MFFSKRKTFFNLNFSTKSKAERKKLIECSYADVDDVEGGGRKRRSKQCKLFRHLDCIQLKGLWREERKHKKILFPFLSTLLHDSFSSYFISSYLQHYYYTHMHTAHTPGEEDEAIVADSQKLHKQARKCKLWRKFSASTLTPLTTI